MFAERYMKIYSDAMFSVTHKLIDQFDQLPEDKDVEMHAAISAISLDVLCIHFPFSHFSQSLNIPFIFFFFPFH